MNTLCEQFSEWLDDVPEQPLSDALAAHAASCEACRRQLALERSMQSGLPAGASLDPSRRAALRGRILAAPAKRPAFRLLRWSWAPLAAAAAIVLAVLVFHPFTKSAVAPTLPSDLLADILGPLPYIDSSDPAKPDAAPTAATESSPMGDLLSAFLGDFEGPMKVALGTLDASRAAVEPRAADAKQ